MGNVFKEGVDDIYEPMADFAIIPPPLYEQLNGEIAVLSESQPAGSLVCQVRDFDDQVVQVSGD